MGCCVGWVCEAVGAEPVTDEGPEDAGGIEEVSESLGVLLTCSVESGELVAECWDVAERVGDCGTVWIGGGVDLVCEVAGTDIDSDEAGLFCGADDEG